MTSGLNNIFDTQPMWVIPVSQDLGDTVKRRAVNAIEAHLAGLIRIQLDANFDDETGNPAKAGTFVTFTVKDGGVGKVPELDGVPVSGRIVAQMIHYRCETYATRRRKEVTFVVNLYGTHETRRDWRSKYQFTIDGAPAEVDEEDDDDDDDEDDEDDDGNEDEDDDGNAREQRDQAMSNDTDPTIRPRFIDTNASLSQAPVPAPTTELMIPGIGGAMLALLQEQRNFTTQIRSEQQINNTELRSASERILSFMRDTAIASEERIAVNYERMLVHSETTRAEMMEMMRESQAFSRAQVTEETLRAQSAEERLRERDRQMALQTDQLFNVASRGWEAFNDGMAMQRDAVGREQEFDRAILGSALQTSQSSNTRSAVGDAMNKILPFGAVAATVWAHKSGNTAAAAFLEQITKILMPIDAPHPGTQNGDSGPVQAEMFDEDPVPRLCVSIRELRASMTNQQVDGLRALVPKAAWKSFEEACRTDIEAACFACIGLVQKFLMSDAAMLGKLQSMLDPAQLQRLLELMAYVSGQATDVTTNPSQSQQQSQQQSPGAARSPGPFTQARSPSGPRRGVPRPPTAEPPSSPESTPGPE